MNRIELIDRIIKIPAGKEILAIGDNNPETFLVRVPRFLLTDNVSNSKLFVLARAGENIITKELEVFSEEENFVNYKWIIDKEYTQGPNLTIQFKIIRTEENTKNDDLDSKIMLSTSNNTEGIWHSLQNIFKITEVLNSSN